MQRSGGGRFIGDGRVFRRRPLILVVICLGQKMAKPPKDANPEKFIIGQGSYTNLRTAVPYNDDKEFRIDPSPMPIVSIAVLNGVFIAVSGAFYWIGSTYGTANKTMVSLATIGIGTMTCALFTAFTYYSFDKARRLGPWLVVNKITKKVTLPREDLEFDASEIVHLQYITTKRLDWGEDRLSELNLVTSANGERTRWPLLRSIFNVKAFEYIVEPLLEHTEICKRTAECRLTRVVFSGFFRGGAHEAAAKLDVSATTMAIVKIRFIACLIDGGPAVGHHLRQRRDIPDSI